MSNIAQDYNPHFIMGHPGFYGVEEPNEHGFDNEFMAQSYDEYKSNPEEFRRVAMEQWQNLMETIKELGATVTVLEAPKNQKDFVYVADPSLSLIIPASSEQDEDKYITRLSCFSNLRRQGEVEFSTEAIKSFDKQNDIKREFYKSSHYAEGTGDMLYDPFRDRYWGGYVDEAGPDHKREGRSDIASHKSFEKITGVPVISIKAREPFYHIDTFISPLPNGHMLVCKEAMHPESYNKLIEEGFTKFGLNPDDYIIPVNMKDADILACNTIAIGNTIVMPTSSDDLKKRIKDKGYDVRQVDVSQFIATGGAIHCMTNKINETRIVGGRINQLNLAQ